MLLRWLKKRPRLSVVVVVYDMRREAPRTLHSLSTDYQQGVTADDYEVVVVENGSNEPLAAPAVEALPGNFRYHYIEDASPSPAGAINFGIARSRGGAVGVMIDGARIVTPGIVRWALAALDAFPRPVVSTMGFHLGPDFQTRSVLQGYDQQREDELLDGIGWPEDGYRLFEISAFAGSSELGWWRPIAESNAIFMPRPLFDALGGYDEGFAIPGGGLVNLDFYRRACELEDSTLVMLLGEGSFHQIHGGAMAAQPPEKSLELRRTYDQEYVKLRRKEWEWPTRQAVYFGEVHSAVVPWLETSCERYDV